MQISCDKAAESVDSDAFHGDNSFQSQRLLLVGTIEFALPITYNPQRVTTSRQAAQGHANCFTERLAMEFSDLIAVTNGFT